MFSKGTKRRSLPKLNRQLLKLPDLFMPPSQPSKRFQDILRRRQQSSFVGRKDQLDLFQQNLTYPPEDDRRYFVFNPWGQGGVGKTTLLNQFRDIAYSRGCLTAYSDEGVRDIPDLMARFADDLAKQGHEMTEFSKRYRLYRQKQEELEADPEAPRGFSAFLGRTMAKTAVKIGRRVPGAGVAFDLMDEDMLANQAGEWTAFVAKKLTNKDEIRLVREPIEVLTPLFLQDWNRIARQADTVLMFDTYEQTGEFLDSWLREILQERYGDIPSNFIWIVSGREELNRNHWASYEGIITRLPLEPFSEAEAKQYLAQKGVTDERTIEMILNLSGRLPLLVATLSESNPDQPQQVSNPSDTAVARFLKWENDPQRQQMALDAALPRTLNQDVIAQLRSEDGATEMFTWLKQKPFVRKRTDGWAYHDVVRTQMLRHKRATSPKGWAELHGRLASYYESQRNALELDEDKGKKDSQWQAYTLNALYHRLCQAPKKHLPAALNEGLTIAKSQEKFAREWANVVIQAGADADIAEIQRLSKHIVDGLKAYSERRYRDLLKTIMVVVGHKDITPESRAAILAGRGEAHRLMQSYDEALKDFNRAIELDSKYKSAIVRRGITYQLMERDEEALQDFNRAIELDPESKWAITSRGITYRLMGRYEEALQDFNHAVELEPEYGWAIAHRGITYRLMERDEEALQDFNHAIELDPEYQWAVAQRGITYRLRRRYKEALQDLNRALEIDPEYGWAIAQRGRIYLLMGQYEEALQDFNRAIEIDQDKNIWAIANRGMIYRLTRHYKEALQDLNRAIELDPEYKQAICGRGEVYLLTSKYQEALADLNRAVELDPENDWRLYTRGLIYKALKQLELSQLDFSEAIRLAQKDYEKDGQNQRNTFNLALYHLGADYDEQAKHFYRSALRHNASVWEMREAIQDLKDFLEVFPNHGLARQAYQVLQQALQNRN